MLSGKITKGDMILSIEVKKGLSYLVMLNKGLEVITEQTVMTL